MSRCREYHVCVRDINQFKVFEEIHNFAKQVRCDDEEGSHKKESKPNRNGGE